MYIFFGLKRKKDVHQSSTQVTSSNSRRADPWNNAMVVVGGGGELLPGKVSRAARVHMHCFIITISGLSV